MKSFTAAALLLISATSVSCHATFQQLWVDGVDQVSTCARLPNSNSPIQDASSNDMRCNAGSAAAASTCAVTAGANLTVEMHQHESRACSEEAIGGAHRGPTLIYMSKVDDASTADGSSTWFKVSELGYNPTTKLWADQVLNNNCGHYSFSLPVDLAAGDYLVRAEQIALHAAGSVGGAQFYMTCYQITVGGSGSAVPKGQVLIPSADVYTATDPGIKFDLYGAWTEYDIPGPAIYGGGASSGGNGSVVASGTDASPAVSTKAVGSVTSASTSASVVSAQAAATSTVPTTFATSISPQATKAVASEDTATPAESGTTTTTSASSSTETSATPSDVAGLVTAIPSGTTMQTLLKWLQDMLDTMLKQ